MRISSLILEKMLLVQTAHIRRYIPPKSQNQRRRKWHRKTHYKRPASRTKTAGLLTFTGRISQLEKQIETRQERSDELHAEIDGLHAEQVVDKIGKLTTVHRKDEEDTTAFGYE